MIVRTASAVILCVFVATSLNAAESALRRGSLDDHMAGGKVTAEGVKGKVVLFAYLGNATRSRDTFLQMVEVHKKYAKNGNFTSFVSFMADKTADAKKFYSDNGAGVPVYSQCRLNHASSSGRLPQMVLFDHNGNVLKNGTPGEVMHMVEAAVKAAPGGAAAAPGGEDLKHCASQAKSIADGRPLPPILSALDKMAESDDEKGKEARLLARQTREWITTQAKQLTEMAEKTPAATLLRIESFVKRLGKLEEAAAMKKLLASLKKDKHVSALTRIIKELERLQAKIKKKGESKSTEKSQEKIKAKLDKLMETKGISDAVAAEAKGLAEGL